MEIAIVGLIGVVLGGLLTGGTQMFLEWRRERRAVRRAKRLVGGELLHATMIFRTLSTAKSWPYFPDVNSILPTTAWQEHSAHLADVLDEDLWNELVMTYTTLEIDRARLTLAKDVSPDTLLTDAVIEQMKDTAIKLERLRRALGGGGGWLEDIPKLVTEPRKAK